ncbi:hypothetical protein PWT90_04410 [Aphanocladium album]|nr:hypothetical protein PWT90_04410 [Aphanocladium album]
MNATKRKFNALLQGLNSPRPSANDQQPRKTADIAAGKLASPSTPSQAQKKRRMGAFADGAAVAGATTTTTDITSSLPSLASISSLRRPLQTPAPAARPPEVASRYCPADREQLLRRLATFGEITTWAPKPDRVSDLEWAKRGWVSVSKECVRCALCHKELVVKLNRKQQDGKEVSVLIASEIALVEKYAGLIVSSHQPDCLWKKRGCDDTLLRISFSSSSSTLESLRQRYDELCFRQSFLPYEFNLRLPEDMVIDTVLEQLPDDFFTHPPPPAANGTAAGQSPNRAALALALTGWQGLSNSRIGAVPNSASCHTCLRRLGLWIFKSKEVTEDGQVLVPATMNHLDPIREHRYFCPWKSPQAQSRIGTTGKDAQATASVTLLQMLKNESDLRNLYAGRSRKTKPQTPIVAEKENTDPATPQKAPPVILEPMSNPQVKSSVTEFDDAERDAKDKERWARLRKVKSLFDTKSNRKLKRPGTPQSAKATTPQK